MRPASYIVGASSVPQRIHPVLEVNLSDLTRKSKREFGHVDAPSPSMKSRGSVVLMDISPGDSTLPDFGT